MDFFNPGVGSSDLFEMGGLGHVALVMILFGLLAAMIVYRKELPKLRASRAFMAGTAATMLVLEAASYVIKFIYPLAPVWERLPLHLCASMKIAVALFILFERYDLAKVVAIWAIGCGFISFANLNLEGGSFGNFGFWHYVFGHLYIFVIPLLLFLTGEFRHTLRSHLLSMGGLLVWSLIIFGVNWRFDTNYMYSGPHNQTAVPFIPDAMMVWPFNYVSYVLTALVLLNLIYVLLSFTQGRFDRGRDALPSSAESAG